jgi:hypothetical protein
MSQTEPCGEFDMIIVGIETYGGMKKLREVNRRKKISSGVTIEVSISVNKDETKGSFNPG